MKRTEPFSYAEASAAWSYSPDSGEIRWKVRVRGRGGFKSPGDIAGALSGRYWSLYLNAQRAYGHRVAWLLMTGHWPAQQVDHANGNNLDNRWCNLRLCTVSQNNTNRHVPVRSASGLVGAVKNGNRWTAKIRNDGPQKVIGHFDIPQDAHAAYMEAALKTHGPFARKA